MDYICLYGKRMVKVLVVLVLTGCVSSPPSRSMEQFDRAENAQRSFESSAAGAEYGVRR